MFAFHLDVPNCHRSHSKYLKSGERLAACKMRGRTCRGLNAFGSILIDLAPGGHIFTLDMGEECKMRLGLLKKGGKES